MIFCFNFFLLNIFNDFIKLDALTNLRDFKGIKMTFFLEDDICRKKRFGATEIRTAVFCFVYNCVLSLHASGGNCELNKKYIYIQRLS